MTRWKDANNAAAALRRSLALVVLADLNFDSGTLYVHDGSGALTVGTTTYQGVGQFGAVDAVQEGLTNIAQSVRLVLTGVDSTLIATVTGENYQGRTVTLYVGLLDVNTLAWYAVPQVLWEGRMDYVTAELAQNQGKLALNCEHRLNREPQAARYTDEDQQIRYPGDTFFNLTWQIPLATTQWGSVSVFHPSNVSAPRTAPGAGQIIGGHR